MTARPPAHEITAGKRVRVAGHVHTVTRTAQRLVSTRIGGERHMQCMELDDGTRYDAPLDMRLDVVGGGAR